MEGRKINRDVNYKFLFNAFTYSIKLILTSLFAPSLLLVYYHRAYSIHESQDNFLPRLYEIIQSNLNNYNKFNSIGGNSDIFIIRKDSLFECNHLN